MNISAFLRAHDLFLRKDLGQHFLTDEGVLRTIVETAKIEATDHIVEIGAGIGILTKDLLKHAGKVTAIECDARLIPLLQAYVGCLDTPSRVIPSGLTIVHGDALEVPFPSASYKIVANIPYHITSPLLRHAFLESEVHPTTMTLLIQREVAEKICLPSEALAQEGEWKDAGLLTILVGLFGLPKMIKIVPPEAFLPPPKVDSAILHIECFERPLADAATIKEVFRLTKVGFSQKRKMLRNTLGALEGGMALLTKAGIDPTRRPQTVTVEEWMRLAEQSLA